MSDKLCANNPVTTLIAIAAAMTIGTGAAAAPRPASDADYQRTTGSAPAARPAPQQQGIYTQSSTPAYAANSAISRSIRSAAPNQDKIFQYVSAAVRSDSDTAGVIRDAVGTAPQFAETVVHAAIKIRPDQTESITRTALTVAPQEADRVTYAAIAANPRQAAAVVRGAMAGAPDKQARIAEAARLAAAKYQINDPAFAQALVIQQAAPEPVADDDALYYGEESERDDIPGQVVATTAGMRPTLMPRLQRARNVPTPAGNAREY